MWTKEYAMENKSIKDITLIERYGTDVTPVIVGHEKCLPGHKFGPAVREYYLIHFCLSGRGSFTDGRGTHTVTSGEAFIIREGEVTVYSADENDPWEYAWIGFIGERSDCFISAPSVASLPARLGERVRELVIDDVTASEPYIAVIYDLMYYLFKEHRVDSQTDRLRRVHRYIRYNYMRDLSVSEISHTFGFDRSYLFRIFKQRYGIGLKEYITKIRMENAARLLCDGFSVAEVASMVGYPDAFNFSKAFKLHYGIPPSKYGK